MSQSDPNETSFNGLCKIARCLQRATSCHRSAHLQQEIWSASINSIDSARNATEIGKTGKARCVCMWAHSLESIQQLADSKAVYMLHTDNVTMNQGDCYCGTKKRSFIDVWWIMVQFQSHHPVLLQSDPCVSLTLHGASLNAFILHYNYIDLQLTLN